MCSDGDVATLHFNCARAALKEGLHVRALEQSSCALEKRPEYANAAMLQAECYMELLDFESAAMSYRRVAALEPTNPAWADCASRAAAMASASAYDVLGVAPRAEPSEVKRAYHAQCLQWHPDKHQASAEARRRANSMFARISAAYELLSDPRKRAELDAQIATDAALKRYRDRTAAAAEYAAAAAAVPPAASSSARGEYAAAADHAAAAAAAAAPQYHHHQYHHHKYHHYEHDHHKHRYKHHKYCYYEHCHQNKHNDYCHYQHH